MLRSPHPLKSIFSGLNVKSRHGITELMVSQLGCLSSLRPIIRQFWPYVPSVLRVEYRIFTQQIASMRKMKSFIAKPWGHLAFYFLGKSHCVSIAPAKPFSDEGIHVQAEG
jgi:hypothetical protein